MGTFRINITEQEGTDLSLSTTGTAGEALVAGDLCYLNTDGKYWKANANAYSTCSTELRIARTNLAVDEVGTFIGQGSITSSGLTVGVRYYVANLAGQITTVELSSPNVVRYIGTASSATQLEFNPMDVNYNSYLLTLETDKNYFHNQASASASWNIAHNLGKKPSVTIIDSGGNQVIGDIVYVDDNNVTLNFTAAFSGTATLN